MSLISPSTCISEGDMGVTNATLCVGLDSSFTLERDVELLLNTASVTASKGAARTLASVTASK